MNKTGIILFIVLSAIILLIIYNLWLMMFFECDKTEAMIDIKPLADPNFSRTQCKYLMGETMKTVLNDNNVNQTDSYGSIHIPCGYDEIDHEINQINPVSDQRIHIIHNADYISAKDYLWNRLVMSSGIDRAKTIMPNTYILNNNADRIRLQQDYKKGKLYIMKKNIQRQEGLKITDSLDDILNAPSSFVLAQELLQDPYLINVSQTGLSDDRKINMRFYILVVCQENNMDVYVFDNGFMYYTKESFKKNSLEMGPNVTTGYIDRWVYENNPLTHEDFRNYLDKTDRTLTVYEQNIVDQGLKLSDVVFNRIYNLLRETMITVVGKVCDGSKLKSNVSFQLFGADIAINDQLWPMLMEINKGPDLGSKGSDGRDASVKQKCVKDMLRIIGAVNDNEKGGFIQIINKEGNRLGTVCL